MVCQTDTLQWRDASVEKSASPNPKPATASAMAQLVVAQQIASTLLPLCLEKYQQQQKVAEVICELQKTMKKCQELMEGIDAEKEDTLLLLALSHGLSLKNYFRYSDIA